METYSGFYLVNISTESFDYRIIYNGYLFENNITEHNSVSKQVFFNRIKELEGQLNSMYSSNTHKILMLCKKSKKIYKHKIRKID
ncbi:hypothetical protein [Clostridium saccharoperbutylacetonicum]|uniref:hypothetical protein n=1 Tax=Clostridium saccharoperbutylacetonicum TaxID=36745 RepID=UPI0039EA2AC3